MTSPTTFIIAGEASGDMHGAHLLKQLKQHAPTMTFYGMGSTQLANAGMNLIVNSEHLSVVGFVEVLTKLKLIRKAFKQLKLAIAQQKPELVILIDYPGFNLRLAKTIKRISPATQIFYFISPQIWAWRYHRIKIIKKYIDLMMVIFPFEVALYERENVPVKYVGNPLLEQVKTVLAENQRRDFFKLKPNTTLVGLMPGSRHQEIKNHLPILLKTAELLKANDENIEFILPLAHTLTEKDLTPYLTKSNVQVTLVRQHTYDAMSICDAIIVASGTATLEVALLGKPMVILYKGSAISYYIAKYLVKIPYIGLCNIVAQDCIAKEFIQDKATPENLAAEVNLILNNTDYHNNIIQKLSRIRTTFSESSPSDIGQVIHSQLNE